MLIVAAAEVGQGQPVRREGRHIAQDGAHPLEFLHRQIAFRQHFQNDSDLLAAAEWHADSPANIIGVCFLREIIEAARQRHIECNAHN